MEKGVGRESPPPRDLKNTSVPGSCNCTQKPLCPCSGRDLIALLKSQPSRGRSHPEQVRGSARASGGAEPTSSLDAVTRRQAGHCGPRVPASCLGVRRRSRNARAAALQLGSHRPVEGSGSPTLGSSGVPHTPTPSARAHPSSAHLATP